MDPLHEFLLKMEERVIDLRRRLEPLELGELSIGEIPPDAGQPDPTGEHIIGPEHDLASCEAVTAKLRADGH